MLLSAHVERFSVSCMRFLFYSNFVAKGNVGRDCCSVVCCTGGIGYGVCDCGFM